MGMGVVLIRFAMGGPSRVGDARFGVREFRNDLREVLDASGDLE